MENDRKAALVARLTETVRKTRDEAIREPLDPEVLKAFISGSQLERERRTYERMKAALLPEYEGKYAVFHGDEFAGAWETYSEALEAAYRLYGVDDLFMVKQVLDPEPVIYMNREAL